MSGGRPPATRSLSHRVTAFCRALRRAGVKVGVADAALALDALAAVEATDRQDAYLALRTALCRRREDLAPFDALFAAWFESAARPGPDAAVDSGAEASGSGEVPAAERELSLEDWADPEPEPAGGVAQVATYSPAEVLAHRDFAHLDEGELAQVERLVAAVARRLATRRSRRWRPARRGERPDLRRTLRRSLSTAGIPVRLCWRSRQVTHHRVVALLDISRSMEPYIRFLLQLLYALQVRLRRVESFVFSTRLTRVTPWLRRHGYRQSVLALGRLAAGWAGGTRIGESLDQFVARYGARLLTPRTVVIILSDGWDMGEPELVRRTMAELKRRSGLVIWLNPLLGSPGYRPETRGMKAALPYIDVFAPAHNVESLRRLERLLRMRTG